MVNYTSCQKYVVIASLSFAITEPLGALFRILLSENGFFPVNVRLIYKVEKFCAEFHKNVHKNIFLFISNF